MTNSAGNEKQQPLINEILKTGISPGRIEEMSLEQIEKEAPRHNFSVDEWVVVKRILHTTADFGLIGDIVFSPDFIAAAVSALKDARPVFTDSNMIRSGISLARLKKANEKYCLEKIHCHVADEDVSRQAADAGLPRSLFAARKAANTLHGGIALFGNAPVALLELNRMIIEENIQPAFVVAMPVGFVHVVESKEELMSLNVPYVAIRGRRGGSPLAVAALHALCGLAEIKRV